LSYLTGAYLFTGSACIRVPFPSQNTESRDAPRVNAIAEKKETLRIRRNEGDFAFFNDDFQSSFMTIVKRSIRAPYAREKEREIYLATNTSLARNNLAIHGS